MQQLAPNNPERFYPYACVLAPEAFDSGTHLLETIHIGLVTIESNQGKETAFNFTPMSGVCGMKMVNMSYDLQRNPSVPKI